MPERFENPHGYEDYEIGHMLKRITSKWVGRFLLRDIDTETYYKHPEVIFRVLKKSGFGEEYIINIKNELRTSLLRPKKRKRISWKERCHVLAMWMERNGLEMPPDEATVSVEAYHAWLSGEFDGMMMEMMRPGQLEAKYQSFKKNPLGKWDSLVSEPNDPGEWAAARDAGFNSGVSRTRTAHENRTKGKGDGYGGR